MVAEFLLESLHEGEEVEFSLDNVGQVFLEARREKLPGSSFSGGLLANPGSEVRVGTGEDYRHKTIVQLITYSW